VERNRFGPAGEALDEEGFAGLALTFEELEPGGEARAVTLASRGEFAARRREALLRSMDRQIGAMRSGMEDGGFPREVPARLPRAKQLSGRCFLGDALDLATEGSDGRGLRKNATEQIGVFGVGL
jgi:hypothetical protein